MNDSYTYKGIVTALAVDGEIFTAEDVRKLQQERNALEHRLIDVSVSCKLANEIRESIAEKHDALAATVSEFLPKVAKVCSYLNDGGLKTNGLSADIRVLRDLLSVSPQQHLRDVRAEAASKAYRHCLNHYSDIQPSKFTAICDEYIEQLKGGKL